MVLPHNSWENFDVFLFRRMVARGTSTPSTPRLLRIKVWTSMGKNWRFGLKGSVHGIYQQWCEDRALTLLEGAPKQSQHGVKFYTMRRFRGVFGRMVW